ncbi:MAG TPA: protein kinase [Candidatus Polarisedimenticolaceae bacterium]|nr:protein kinase [Candidatus Polarisedimenticolaceae bacterium]
MTLSPGKDLSHYRLVERIGEGGMGVVWRATDTTLGRDVAIKVLPAEFASDPERMARFEREARLLASLNHPGIAAVYGVGSAEGVRFLAMELVEGEDLAERLSQGPMPVVEALETARQIAEALEVAHEKGIIHRDLKPANVKLTPDGQVKVLDFGLAKATVAEGRGSGPTSTPTILPTMTSAGTAMGMILGTAAYMSPEQARGKAVDRRADIWALGCVLYECLTGKRAFDGETASDTIAKVLEREPSFAALPAATPARVRELLQRCLTKDPKLRLRDMGDARIVLDEALASRTPSGSLPVAVDAPVAATAGGRRASPVILAVVGVAGLVIGAVAWALVAARPAVAPARGTECVTVTMPPELSVPGLGAFSITPDGKTIVVRAQPKNADGSSAGPPRIYARRLDQYEFKELPGTEGAQGFLTPRSGSFLFFAPVSAGAPQFRGFRAPVDGSAPPTSFVDNDTSWTWTVESRDGDLLAVKQFTDFVRCPPGGPPSSPIKIDSGRQGVVRYELWNTLPGNGGVLTNIVVYDAKGWHYSFGVLDPKTGKLTTLEEDGGNPVYSTAGYLVFSRGSTLMAMPFDAQSAKPRGPAVAVWSGVSTSFTFQPGYFEISDDGTLVYRPGQTGGIRQMAYVDASGRVDRWHGEPRGIDIGPEPSPDGRRFACSIVNGRGIDEIFVSDLDRPGFRRVSDDPNADCSSAQWSPDGRRLAYARGGKDGKDGVYVVSADGGDARRVYATVNQAERAVAYSWLPDGSALFIARNSPGKGELILVPVAGDEKDAARVKVLATNELFIDQPRVSPEGRRLAYMSAESGMRQVYVAELRPDRTLGHALPLQTSGGREPRWSRDGKWLFVRDERDRVMKVAVGPAPDITVSSPEIAVDLVAAGVTLWSVLPDGRFFVGLKSDDEGDLTKLSVVLNWTDEMKRKLGAAH